MNHTRDTDASCLTFRLDGRLTFRDSEAFETIITAIAASSLPWVRFDLGGLDYVDSYGIGLIALAREAAENAGAKLELVRPQGAVAEVLSRISFEFIAQSADETDLRIGPALCRGDEVRIALAGSFRVKDQGRFLPVIQSAMDGDFRRMVLDLGQLRFVDSIGVSLIMTTADELRKAGKELLLGNPGGEVRELLRLTAIDTVVRVVETP